MTGRRSPRGSPRRPPSGADDRCSPVPAREEAFGSRVAISGDVLVVTAPQATVAGKTYAARPTSWCGTLPRRAGPGGSA